MPTDEEQYLTEGWIYFNPPVVDQDCEDQALCPTKHCTICRPSFGGNDKPVYVPLVKRGRYWCCCNCNASYGEQPHPDLP
jgi:hypothetical protein